MATYDLLRFTATAGQTDFLITFDYNTDKPASVQVVKDGVEQVSGVDYNLVDNFTVRFTTALLGDEKVVVRRVTDRSVRGVPAWNNTAPLSKASHNKQDDEMYRFAQELDVEKGLPRSDTTFQWDGQDENGDPARIENISDPVASLDVVNLQTLEARVGGGTVGLAGFVRGDFVGDGSTTLIEILPVGGGQLSSTSKVILFKQGDSNPIDPDDYALDSTKRKIILDNPSENGTRYDFFVLTASVITIDDGDILPVKIALAEDFLITGDSSGEGSAVARSAILLSELGAPTSSVAMGAQKLTGVLDPTLAQDAATKTYVDTAVAAVSTFPTVTNNSTVGRNTPVLNSSGGTILILATLTETEQVTGEVEFRAEYADNAEMTTNLQLTGGTVRFANTDVRHHHQLSFLVPSGKYWQILATSGSTENLNRITIAYQKGS